MKKIHRGVAFISMNSCAMSKVFYAAFMFRYMFDFRYSFEVIEVRVKVQRKSCSNTSLQ